MAISLGRKLNVRKQGFRATAIALSVSCAVVASPVAAFAAAGDATITGKVLTPGGAPLAGVTLEADVEPNPDQLANLPAGATVTPVPIASAVTGTSGAFTLSVTDFGPVAQAADSDGLVSLVLSAPTDDGQVFYRTRMVYTAPGRLIAYTPDVTAEATDADTTRARTTSVSAAGVPDVVLVTLQATPNDPPTTPAPAPTTDVPTPTPTKCPKLQICTFEPNGDTTTGGGATDETTSEATEPAPAEPAIVDAPRTDQQVYAPPADSLVKTADTTQQASTATAAAKKSFDPDVWCGGHHWYLKKSKDLVERNVSLADVSTGSKTTGEFSYESTKDTSLEIGVTGKNNEIVASLGMSKGKTASATITSRIKKNTNAEHWVSFDFNLYDVWCQHNTTYVKWWSGYTEYRVKGFSGNYSWRRWTPFTCQSANKNFIDQDADVKIADKKTSTKNGSFGFGSHGSLKATQTWTATQTVTYKNIPGNTGYNLCGDTGRYYTGVSRTRAF